MFQSYGLHSITFVRRRAASNWVVDDAIADLSLVGDVEFNGSPILTGQPRSGAPERGRPVTP